MKSERSTVSYLLEWASPHKSGYIAAILFAIIGVACGVLPYYAISKVVALLFEGSKAMGDYQSWLVVIAVSFLGQILFHNLSTYTSHMMTFTVIAETRQRMCDKLLSVPMGNIQRRSSGEMKTLIVEKVDSIEPTLAHLVPELTSKLLVPIITWIFLMTIDWRIGLFALITIPIGLGAYMGMMIGYEKGFSRYTKANKDLNSVAVEYINGIEVIKAFNNSAKSYQKFTDAAFEAAHSAIDWMKQNQVFFATAMTILPATLLTVLPACVYYFLANSLSMGDFVTIIVLSLGMMPPLIGAMSMSDDIAKIGTIVGDIVGILDEEELVRPHEEVTLSHYNIDLNDVSFGYSDKEVLHNISLSFGADQVTALVGPSGSGKSTITKLIASMWEVGSGTITIGGTNIKDIPLEQLNRLVAYVSQDNFLFDESILENIRKGNLSATDEDVIAMAKASGCHEFIINLSDGYQTIVGGAGGHLSGGERQRVSIARAMLKDAPIIILDEATAYTDPENEAVIQEAVSKLVRGKTLIVVAHRLSTVTDSDKIVVVKQGNIHATGTHQELLADCVLYRELYQAHMGAKDGKGASA